MAVKGICPVCEEAGRTFLHEIVDTGKKQHPSKSSHWWQLVLHSDGQGGLCPGGGKSI